MVSAYQANSGTAALVAVSVIVTDETAVMAWGFTMTFASAHHSRLRDEMVRAEQRMRREVQHWKDEAARARSHAAQLRRRMA